MLSSFEIINFRTFKHLRLTGLGDVNLFVGENNVGKTMLLEALRLYQGKDEPASLLELLRRCNEFARGDKAGLLSHLALFHGRRTNESGNAAISLRAERELVIRYNSSDPRGFWVGNYFVQQSHGLPDPDSAEQMLPPLVPVCGISEEALGLWWDEFGLTLAEQRVIACLQIASPVVRLNLVARPGGRMFNALLKGATEPVPLRSLGAGVSRLLEFALALERARSSGMLLIDEIENGVYYGAHEGLWRFLIEAARLQGVQLFVTTHSWDCIRGLQQALNDYQDTRALLVRLQRKGEDVFPVHYNREEIAVAVAEDVEVR